MIRHYASTDGVRSRTQAPPLLSQDRTGAAGASTRWNRPEESFTERWLRPPGRRGAITSSPTTTEQGPSERKNRADWENAPATDSQS